MPTLIGDLLGEGLLVPGLFAPLDRKDHPRGSGVLPLFPLRRGPGMEKGGRMGEWEEGEDPEDLDLQANKALELYPTIRNINC